jgi:hypothetical protein
VLVRQCVFKKLSIGALAISLLGSLGDWQTEEDKLRAALAPTLMSSGSAARLYFTSQCSMDSDTFGRGRASVPFPRLALAPSPANAPPLKAVQAILRDERDVVVAEDRLGMIRITLGKVPVALLSTRITRLTFDPDARWNPDPAIWAIERTSEIQAAMRRLNIQRLPVLIDILLTRSRDNRLPHLPTSLENVTMDEALDLVARTFKQLVVYGVCTQRDGQSTLWIDSTPLTECDSHYQVFCFMPATKMGRPTPLELSPDPSLSPNPRNSGGSQPPTGALSAMLQAGKVRAITRSRSR